MNHPNRSKQQQAKHPPTAWGFPSQLTVGSVSRDICARNHALCDGAQAVAHVLGAGYPASIGWAPRTEALASEIVKRYNTQPELLAALKSAEWTLDVLNDWFKKNNSDQNSRIAINTRNQARGIIDKAEGR